MTLRNSDRRKGVVMKGEKLMEENTHKLGHGTHGTGQGMVATLMQFDNYQIENALLSAMFHGGPSPHAVAP